MADIHDAENDVVALVRLRVERSDADVDEGAGERDIKRHRFIRAQASADANRPEQIETLLAAQIGWRDRRVR